MVKINRNNNEQDVIRPVGLITLTDPSSVYAEQYRTVRTNIQFSTVNEKMKSLVVTSAGPSEGKSTTSGNLAVVFANSGYRVLLVDGDMRRPTVHKTFRVINSDGFSTLLENPLRIPEDVIQKTVIENLDIITSGPLPSNPSELLSNENCVKVIARLEEQYDIVIYDMPPIVAVTDAQLMATRTDGVILVVRQKKTQKQALKRAKDLLDLVNANIIGVILNGIEEEKGNEYYYYSYKSKSAEKGR